MRLRGRRVCAECGERWSYFETGDVSCPGCGSLHSTAADDEPVRHTAGDATLDLAEARAAVDERPLREVAALAGAAARSFLVDRGFIAAGELRPLDDVTVAAAELRAAATLVGGSVTPDEAAERYLLDLLRGAPEGRRPDTVPPELRAARGLGAAMAVDRYRGALARTLDDRPDPEARRLLGLLRDHLRRIEALDGEVSPATADAVVATARDLGDYLRGDGAALASAADRLSRL